MFPVLDTDRLVLRELTEYDAKAIFSILSNEEVTRYYGKETFKNINEAENFITYFQNKFKENRGFRWGIELKSTHELIGTVGLHAWVPKQKRAEIGYEIHPKYWNQGYALESVLKIISFGFHSLQLIRIGAVVFPENEPSNKLLLKMGFQKEGLLRQYIHQNEVSHDTYIYSILNKNTKPNVSDIN